MEFPWCSSQRFFLHLVSFTEFLFGKPMHCPETQKAHMRFHAEQLLGRPLLTNIARHNCAIVFLAVPYVFPKEHQNTYFIRGINSTSSHRSHSSKEAQEKVQLKAE